MRALTTNNKTYQLTCVTWVISYGNIKSGEDKYKNNNRDISYDGNTDNAYKIIVLLTQ